MESLDIKIDWDLEKECVTARMTFADVPSRRIDDKVTSTNMIVKEVLKTHLKGTKIRWRGRCSTASSVYIFNLHFNYGEGMTEESFPLNRVHHIVTAIYRDATERINYFMSLLDEKQKKD